MSFYSTDNILRRLGNKNKLIPQIMPHLPDDFDCLISFFYGTGSLENQFLGRIKQLIANDYDKEVYNVYKVLINQPERLQRVLEAIPYHQCVFDDFKRELPDDPVRRAAGFLVLSNWSFKGKGDTLRFGNQDNNKRITLRNLKANYERLVNNPITTVQFLCCDFRDVVSKISFKRGCGSCFGYLDPPYFQTGNNYKTPKWTWQDTCDCFELMQTCGFRCAMSEFAHPKVIESAQRRGLNIIEIGERQTIGNRNVEILITNYEEKQRRMFL